MTIGRVLPTEGSTTLDDLAHAIAAAPSTLGVEDTAELKAVLVPIGEGKLVSFAAVLRVGWRSDLPKEGAITHEAGGITLLGMRFGASNLENGRDLTSLFDQWRVYGHYLPTIDFHDTVHIYWHESYSEWNVEPTWVIQLQEKTTTSLNRQLRTGPFLDPESEFFAENIGEAARKWLGDPGVDQSSSLGIYKVVIRDRRA